MPILQGIKRISPLDSNKNVKIGVPLPLNSINFFKGTETMKDQIKTNLINLLLTSPGERINLPNFGVGIKNLLFEQNIDLENLKEKIQNQISLYMGSIKLHGISINESEDKHTIFISLSYIYLLDNTPQTIQLNFR